MGFYVNPRNESKEDFLNREGVAKSLNINWDDVPLDEIPVVLVDNGPFTAAGICYNERELAEFTRLEDPRPRVLFLVKRKKLADVSDLPEIYIR